MKLTGKLKGENFKLLKKKSGLKSRIKSPRILVLAADAHLARIYLKENNIFELIGEAEPEEKNIESEINNSALSRMAGAPNNKAHQKFEPRLNETDYKKYFFSQEISKLLEKIEPLNIFDKLIIIAPPKMLGHLRSNLSEKIKKFIIAEVDKDLTKLKDREFETALKKIIWF